MAGIPGALDVFEPIHLPFVSRLGARDSAECYGHHLAGYVPPGESESREDG